MPSKQYGDNYCKQPDAPLSGSVSQLSDAHLDTLLIVLRWNTQVAFLPAYSLSWARNRFRLGRQAVTRGFASREL